MQNSWLRDKIMNGDFVWAQALGRQGLLIPTNTEEDLPLPPSDLEDIKPFKTNADAKLHQTVVLQNLKDHTNYGFYFFPNTVEALDKPLVELSPNAQLYLEFNNGSVHCSKDIPSQPKIGNCWALLYAPDTLHIGKQGEDQQ